ncbi:hypothetical protein [Phaeobacter sp. S60]|uniref:hypothetical protein n=1 Tax=Phaeobacter sp. S60 TaxID=1569353 RepID=UPI00058E46AB|nr:hypothetical protein [Phaeobacter sp. S60]KII18261.1 hypothetical protein OO25_04660 [Phaeobacter sp. S60]
MNQNLYLPRTLTSEENTYSEAALVTAVRYVVILAEPGGGKTELMASLAQQLGTSPITASKFRHLGAKAKTELPLVIDAYDELAKLKDAGLHNLLRQAEAANPTHFFLASRSSEWDYADTRTFEDFLGSPPLIVRLVEFDEAEQKEIFDHHVPGENFEAFRTEVARFELEMLLPNPEFLKLFADAYIESDRHFLDKRSIFAQAIERLAREANPEIKPIRSALSINQKVDLASDVFAKLLMSGAEGVSTSETAEDAVHPLLASIVGDKTCVTDILATRMFKPGASEDQHRPVHKIVAEFCAAGYLNKRILDPVDSLTLSKCLPLIAPNSTVRDELRGMLGWMASLGTKEVQEAAIELDPYAVLANGDPSQLDPSSKRLLLLQLKNAEAKDPYFRRGDFWRRYSVAGFFTQEVVEEIKPLLAHSAKGHLRSLILELLAESPAVEKLFKELSHIALSPNESESTRLLAVKCLLSTEKYDYRAGLAVLLFEASQTSLNVAIEIINRIGPETFDSCYLAGFFRICANIYPPRAKRFERVYMRHGFVKRFIARLELANIEYLLDELTSDLACKCGQEHYNCDCRNGVSKIVGSLMDRYFETASPPYDPARVWQWVRNLNFHQVRRAEYSKAVQVLQEDDNLRQGIFAHVLGPLTDLDRIIEVKVRTLFGEGAHAGLVFKPCDHRFVVDLAFETDNSNLWVSFLARHQYTHKNTGRGPDSLRRHMRLQAKEKPALMREWAQSNRAIAQIHREDTSRNMKFRRRMKRHSRQQECIHVENIKFVQKNRELVESGRHWFCLKRFARLVLEKPEEIENEFGDEKLVRTALSNCLDFIDEFVPELQKLAELRCASRGLHSLTILYAACLELMRIKGNLEGIEPRLLKALRTTLDSSWRAVSCEERDALKVEVDRLIFSTSLSVEKYLRAYVEPQLAQFGCQSPEVWLLRDAQVFRELSAKLSIEWLRRFRGLELDVLGTLFDITAQFGARENLEEIIVERCAEFDFFWPEPTGNEVIERKRLFWQTRAVCFLDETSEHTWRWFKSDPDTIFLFYERYGQINRSQHSLWPNLTSKTTEKILDTFIGQWAKVNLPSSHGSISSKEENAYRFLTEVVWSIASDDPDNAIDVLDRILEDPRFSDLRADLRNIHANQMRIRALRNFEPPSPSEIVDCLDHDSVVTVEGLRALIVQELELYQKAVDGSEYNPAVVFYNKTRKKDNKSGKYTTVLKRKNENECTERIAERLSLRLQPLGISITPEHQLKALKRSDFTAAKMIGGTRRLLVTEVKGQWHDELYTAAAEQLHKRYSIHHDAEHQGVFLVIWFGPDHKVAGLKNIKITSAKELKKSIEGKMPAELAAFVDVFVLDVSGV